MDLCPFAYNETAAQENFPLTKDAAIKQGYRWKEPEVKEHGVTLSADKIPMTIAEATDAITQEIIGCEHQGQCNDGCTRAFKIIPAELQLYRQLGIPIPALCPNCRHALRRARKSPPLLYKRECNCEGSMSETGNYKNTAPHFHNAERCPNSFETSYSPDRPEIVYCEQCYQAEVA